MPTDCTLAGRTVHMLRASLTSSLSLTSALSASIVLASRLPTTSHVFSLVLLSVLLFAGWPPFAKHIRVGRPSLQGAHADMGTKESGKTFSLLLTSSMLLLSTCLFPTTSPKLILLFLIVLVNILGPITLHFAWRWKTHRGGGWDPAVVRVKKPSG